MNDSRMPGTDLSQVAPEDLDAGAHSPNSRVRNCLGWRAGVEVFAKGQHSQQDIGVVTTA